MEMSILFKLYFLAIATDFATGVIAAGFEGRLKSRTMSKGLWTTCGEFILLLVSYTGFSLLPELTYIANFFILSMIIKELISINENLVRSNIKMPKWIKHSLEVYDKNADENGPKNSK